MKRRARDWLSYVIAPSLEFMGPEYGGESILEGLLVTGWHESAKYTEIAQIGTGPARGPWQMELVTFNDMWRRWLEINSNRRTLKSRLSSLIPPTHSPEDALAAAPVFACCLARLKYRSIVEALPAPGDIVGWARYWKLYYNTPGGAGKESDFQKAWNDVYDL